MKDLFEHYEDQPAYLKIICDKWQQKLEEDGLDYKNCKSFLNEVEKIGYTFEYGLDAEPFNLRKLDHEKHEDPFFGELYGDYDNDDLNELF